MAAGFSAGLAETALVLGIPSLARPPFLGALQGWMAPLVDLLMVLPAALGGLLLRRWIPAHSWQMAVFGCTIVAATTVLLHIGSIAHWSVLVLSAGIAAQVARAASAKPASFAAGTTWVAVVTSVVVAGFAVLTFGGAAVAERRAIGQLPVPTAARPNVLLITLDTVRADHLSLYGLERQTSPRLQALARDGVRFDRAFSPAPWTLPAHASLFTGKQPHELSADWLAPLDTSVPTLAEHLAAAGYATAGFAANSMYVSRGFGLARGFAHFDDHSLGDAARASALATLITDENHPLRAKVGNFQIVGRRTAEEINHNVLDWLAEHDDRPVFAFINYFDAHYPYLPPEPFRSKYGRNRVGEYRLSDDPAQQTPELAAAMLDDYDGGIAYVDHQLGLLLDALRDSGWLDKTIVIVTSDHGEEFGEHRVYDHGNTLYRQALHVPLVVRYPQTVPAGVSVPQFVSTVDVGATILDLLGLAPMSGQSLARYWREPASTAAPAMSSVRWAPGLPAWLPLSKGDMRAVVDSASHCIARSDGVLELYDLSVDFDELHDLASTPEGQRILASNQVLATCTTDPRRAAASAAAPNAPVP